ncbi:MAG: AAA family ATPase [Rhodospirillaceae bacterium]
MPEVIKLPSSASLAKPGVCEIKAFRDLQDMLIFCQRIGQIGISVGPTGCGKTTTTQAFVDKNLRTFYVRLTTVSNTVQPFLVKLCEALGTYGATNLGKADLFDQAVRKLGRHDHALIIVDEMNHGTAEVIHLLRDLWDAARCGIALVGTPEMETLWVERAGRKAGRGDAFAAFRARIGQRLELTKPGPADVDALCQHLGLKGKRERDLISRHVRAWDGMHSLEQLLRNAQEIAGDGNAVTVEHLFDAASLTGAVA